MAYGVAKSLITIAPYACGF